MTTGTRNLAAMSGCVAIAVLGGVMAGAGRQPDRRAPIDMVRSSRVNITEATPFVATSIGPPDGRDVVMGVRVVREHRGASVRAWVEVAVVQGWSMERATRGPEDLPPGVEMDQQRWDDTINSTFERHMLVGSLGGEDAEAIADAVEGFAALELPDSPGFVRRRAVSQHWSAGMGIAGGEPMSIGLANDDGVYMLSTTLRFEHAFGPALACEIDPVALASALRAGAEQLREMEAQPPLIQRGQ